VGKPLAPPRYTPLTPSTPVCRARNGAFVTPEAVKKSELAAYPPAGAWYDATYVVFAVTSIGVANDTVCQPVGVSFMNVAVANR
jgi:hypothetical protein